ncbi:MAG TPA: nitronate monooxygenase family protein [Macromonas sp.]|nr:nitronate monooxygenase family protein [Macromonas sp.]
MPIPAALKRNLRLPVIGAPMFIVATPELVLAQCKSGIIGAFPALNARPPELLDQWLTRIRAELAADPNAAPFAVNQIIHPSNERLAHDIDLCVKHEVPLVITSLSAPTEVVPRVHAYGGLVFHDVISVRHARKALEAGVDGLILVCAGAGGHAGRLSPFALLREVRRFYDGPIALAGSITDGAGVLAAQAMGADFAYIGTRFIATREANAVDGYKQGIVDSNAEDVVYTPYFTGVHGNYLRQSIEAAGLDPADLPHRDKTAMDFGAQAGAKAWKDIWGVGQGVGNIADIPPAAAVIAQMHQEYQAAKAALCQQPF